MVSITGAMSVFLYFWGGGSDFSGVQADKLDVYESIFQVIVFLACGLSAVLVYSERIDKKHLVVSLVALIVWYVVFEILTLGWAREFSIVNLIASFIYVVLPAALMLVWLRKN